MSTKKVCTQCGTEYGMDQKFCPEDGSPLRAESTDDPLIGQVIADRYHITGLIGEGGMGRVYLAEHVRMGRKSALKVMSPSLATTADAITRFNREASNASRINHPNVAAIYDFGETPNGLLYLAMEFVEGETLHTLIERNGPLPISRAARITKGVADALSAAHHLGIIHRDLKPDNIMLARQHDGSDWVKVVDFGIAKSVAEGAAGQTVTTVGVSLGTPEYMSPEQLAGEKLDQHTDIYSLGLVLFNMLTGELPYPKLTSKETLVRRLTSQPATLSDVRPDITWPRALQAVLDHALAPDPAARYANVAEFGNEVLQAAANAPDLDPDRTVRVSPVRGVAKAGVLPTPTTVKKPRGSTAPVGAGFTVAQSPGQKRSPVALIVTALMVFAAVAGASYAVLQHRAAVRPPRPDTTVATAADTSSARADTTSIAASKDLAASTSQPPNSTRDAKAQVALVPKKPVPRPPNADSIAALQRAEAARTDSIARADSVARADSIAKAAEAQRLASQKIHAQHPWMRANGDSGAGAPNAGFQSAVNDIQGHLQRAAQLITNGQLQRVPAEFRDAQSELKVLRDVMPQAPAVMGLEVRLRQLRSQAFNACVAAAQNDSTAKLRCRTFQPQNPNGRAGRGAQQPPLPALSR